ncbi:MAG: glycosyltransferase family 4 protein [Lachnospiraceae bacterium]|nr:glycosyltransferase family 4 protein [Lachnospiraceae bacterium]
MRVLWVCNLAIPVIATQLNIPVSNREGWLTGLIEKISLKPIGDRLTLAVAFPVDGAGLVYDREIVISENCRIRAFGFGEDINKSHIYDESLEDTFRGIISQYDPEIVHIFGSEFPHTLAAVRAFNKPDRTIIGLQGICSRIAESYTADIPLTVKYGITFRDVVRRDNVWQQIDKFRKRGVNEINAIKLVDNVAGRTDFDKAVAEQIHPGIKYYHLGETMRLPFYQGSWKLESCIPHSIFLSQGDYPLKGFHYVLRAMPRILEEYPDAVVYVAGANLLAKENWKDRIKRCSYGRYLAKLIRKYHLKDHVVMLGKLSADQMKEQYLASNVFVCPSSLENSPNSLGEAMLLGVPCVASNVGGIPSLMVDGQDGILFTAGDVDGLSAGIMEIFSSEAITRAYSRNAKKHAHENHDSDNNYSALMMMYYSLTVFAEAERNTE